MLTAEVRDEIAMLVRGGFEDRARVIEIFSEEMYAPGEFAPAEVSAAVDAAIAAFEADKATWPDVTDCDRLATAFERLRARGLIALDNAGNTQSDGYGDFQQAYGEHASPGTVRGYCFFHRQDLDRALRGGGLYLSFGSVDPEKEEAEGAALGAVVREELERAGFQVEWNGAFDQRLLVPKLVWQKR